MIGIWRIIISSLKPIIINTGIEYIKILIQKAMAKTKTEDLGEILTPSSADIQAKLQIQLLEALIKSTDVMKLVKSQFGYSGYSNPNYINLQKSIEENEIIIESLK